MQHFKYVNLWICCFVFFWCHEQVIGLCLADITFLRPSFYLVLIFIEKRFWGSFWNFLKMPYSWGFVENLMEGMSVRREGGLIWARWGLFVIYQQYPSENPSFEQRRICMNNLSLHKFKLVLLSKTWIFTFLFQCFWHVILTSFVKAKTMNSCFFKSSPPVS